jgi:hypothetical protein
MAVVCSITNAAIMASAVQPEHVDQFNRFIGGIIKLPGKMAKQI